MSQIYNVYCDESCHLQNDGQPIMVLGAIWCPLEKREEITQRIAEIKARHGIGPNFEIKWHKVSPAKVQLYLDLMDYFFDDDDLHFRALIATQKYALQHEAFNQDHDTWYYKMYFDMLKVILNSQDHYRIYLDIKDTRSADKVRHLHNVLAHSKYDFAHEIIERVQNIRSHEVAIMQLVDLLVGTISYANRRLSGNSGKKELVERMRERSKYSLVRSTLYREDKVNLFLWHPSERGA